MEFKIAQGGEGKSFQVFTQGKYKCRIVGGISDLEYSYIGQDKPRYIFLLQPISYFDKGKLVEEFYDTNFEPMKNTYIDKDGNKKPAYLRHNCNYKIEPSGDLSFSLYMGGEGMNASSFALLCNALFGKGKKDANCPYTAVEHFVGDTVIVSVVNKKGTWKSEGKVFANIVDFEKDSEFVVKTQAQLDKIEVSSIEQEKAHAEQYRKDIIENTKVDEASLDGIPF